MRRWNGWGDEAITYPLPAGAIRFLHELLGEGHRSPDAGLEAVLSSIPNSRLRPHPLITTDPLERLRHARGQSLPDWVALRSGRLGVFPDGVAYPNSEAQVQELLRYARATGARLIPFGGGTSVVGGVNPLPGRDPVISVDLGRMSDLLDLDETSRLATLQAGVPGPALEAKLAGRGYTLGHFPQSFEYSTLGGWIATRSSGQQSHLYGRIEALFAGGHVETPIGPLHLPPFPASAAGPDLRQLILGSEGRLGIITRAVLRVRPRPAYEAFYAALFPTWQRGLNAARELAQQEVPLSMIRLSDPVETETTLALSGHTRLLAWADRALRPWGYREDRCLLIYAVTGSRRFCRQTLRRTRAVLRAQRGLSLGSPIGETWRRNRFRAPYLRNTLWDLGYALDTLETAFPWRSVAPGAVAARQALLQAAREEEEPILAFSHISHLYRDGSSVYVTYIFRRAADPQETLRRWRALKDAASRAIQAHGGTISHHHGVGTDHASYLRQEKGPLGTSLLRATAQALDPQGLLNPGKLLDEEPPAGIEPAGG